MEWITSGIHFVLQPVVYLWDRSLEGDLRGFINRGSSPEIQSLRFLLETGHIGSLFLTWTEIADWKGKQVPGKDCTICTVKALWTTLTCWWGNPPESQATWHRGTLVSSLPGAGSQASCTAPFPLSCLLELCVLIFCPFSCEVCGSFYVTDLGLLWHKLQIFFPVCLFALLMVFVLLFVFLSSK